MIIFTKTVWRGEFLGNVIEIYNIGDNGKTLINGKPQKVKYGWFGKSSFESKLPKSIGITKFDAKLTAGWRKVKCSVFANGKQIEMEEVENH